ncbi:MAG: tape measure protein [Hyphomonadaceae bacterium]|nr:tape measure protein [Hyphomonadaceae bacterium]
MATASGLDLARLAIVFDTTTAPGAIAAMQQVVGSSRQVGAAADQTSQKLRAESAAIKETAAALGQLNMAHAAAASGYKRGTTDGQTYARTVMEIKAALDAEARAAGAVASGHQQRAAAIGRLMAASRDEYSRGAINAQQYAARLNQLQVEMNKIAGAQATMANSGKAAAQNMAMLSGAVGGFVGVLGFQGLAAITQFATFIGGLPGDLAHAGDELTRFNARITFAFRGSSEAARLARQDIIALSRDTGVPYSQTGQSYGDLAIAGRGPGLTRAQIGGLTGGFAMLGQMTGSDNASTARAMWQFQQALALGRLTSQDYRFMATSMPAIDDALAAGLGVDVNTIPGRISRGEIDANKMVDALIKGVEVLRESAGGLPQTMERARGRIQTEWELLLSNMEGRVKSSEFYQRTMGWYGQQSRNTGDYISDDPEARLRATRALRDQQPFNAWIYDQQIRDLEAEINSPSRVRGRELTTAAEAARERGQSRAALVGRARQFGDTISNIELQQFDARNTIEQIERGIAAANAPMGASDLSLLRARDRALQEQQRGLAARGLEQSPAYEQSVADRRAIQSAINAGTALPPAEIERLTLQLEGARGQLRRLGYAFDRMAQEAEQAEGDLLRYGAGGGFDIANAARGIMATADSQGRPIGMDTARGMVLRQRFVGAENDLGQAVNDNRRRQIIVNAAGGDVMARRSAELDAAEDEFRSRFGDRADLSAAQAARVDELAAADRRNRAERFAQDDVQSLRERERIDRERLEAMRAQLQLGVQLGQQGRIALAQAERERELRREFPDITAELVAAERDRVAETIRINEQLQLQTEQMARLQDSAATVGRAIGDVLGASISEGIERGRIDGEAALGVLGRSASRILNNLVSNMTAPWERRITEMASGWMGRVGLAGGANAPADKAMEALGAAATEAGESIAGAMIPSVTEAAAKVSLSVSATASETAAKSKAFYVVNAFTGSVLAATKALDLMAASAGAEGGSDLVSAFASAFSIGNPAPVGTPVVPGFASGVRNFSGGWAIVGEEGLELVKLPQGANVYSHRETGAMLGGANVSIVINDQRGAGAAPVEQRETRGPNGERQIELWIKDQVVKTTADADFAAAMGSRFGAKPMLRKS